MNISEQNFKAMFLESNQVFQGQDKEEQGISDFFLKIQSSLEEKESIKQELSATEKSENVEEPTFSELKFKLALMVDNNYSRTQFEEFQEKLDEQERWDKLMEFVDNHVALIEDYEELTPDYELDFYQLTPDLVEKWADSYHPDQMSEEDMEEFLNDLVEAGVLTLNQKEHTSGGDIPLGKLWEIIQEAEDRLAMRVPDDLLPDSLEEYPDNNDFFRQFGELELGKQKFLEMTKQGLVPFSMEEEGGENNSFLEKENEETEVYTL